jgi:ribosomal protein S6--L-glutamate ligase
MKIQFLTRQVHARMNHDLIVRAQQGGHDVAILDVGLFSICFDRGIYYNGYPWTPCDLVYPFWSKQDTFLPLLLQLMQQQGQKIYKPIAHTLPTKLSAALILTNASLPTPRTITSSTSKSIIPLLKSMHMPCVLKLSSSSQGKGVFLFSDEALLLKKIEELCQEGIDYIVQECLYPIGQDVRAFIINDKVVAAMERKSTTGDFRANISLGGMGTSTILSKEEEALVRKASLLFGLRISGVDFMRTHNGPILLEVNKEPGFKGITKATGKDIASMVVEDFLFFCSE